jgi:hypothetical protein
MAMPLFGGDAYLFTSFRRNGETGTGALKSRCAWRRCLSQKAHYAR